MNVIIITINNNFPFILIMSLLDFKITFIHINLNCLFLNHNMYSITSFNYTYYNRLIKKHLVNNNFHIMLTNHIILNNINNLNNFTSFTFILIQFNFNLRFNLILIRLGSLVFIMKYLLF